MFVVNTRTKSRVGPSPAALRNPHGPHQGRLSARPMVLTERTRIRGGATSRRRVVRVWAPR